MMPARPVGLIVLLGSLLHSTTAQSQPAGEVFVPFPEFLTGITTADPATYLGRPGARVESRAAFEQMRRHLLLLYDGVQVNHSFLLNSQHVDCVPVLQQPTARWLGLTQLPSPPPAPQSPPERAPVALAPSPLELGLADGFGNRIACDRDTVPMRRITLEELTRFSTLRQFFRKAPDAGTQPAPAVDFAGYKHRTVSNSLNNLGAQTYLQVWYPLVDQSQGQSHSLSQLWIIGFGGSTTQTAEAGWQVAPGHYNTTAAVLFEYWTADDYVATGCYNLECPGFVQVSNTVVLGVPNWPGPSQQGGQKVVFEIEWYAQTDGHGTVQEWWLAHNCDACFIGYLPASIYHNGQLAHSSNYLEFGGETYSGTHTVFGAMGSGALPSAGIARAATQENIYYWDLNFAIHPAGLGYSNILQTNACYGELCVNPNCNWFMFGGPGGTGCGGE
jgi:Neprosin